MTNYFFDQRFLHGGDYNPDQWLDYPEILKKDLAYMQKAHVNTVTLGVFAWSALEPTEGSISLTGLMNSLMRSMLWGQCHFGYPQRWSSPVVESEISGSQSHQCVWTKHTHGFRHNHCYSSPIYREKCGRSTQN